MGVVRWGTHLENLLDRLKTGAVDYNVVHDRRIGQGHWEPLVGAEERPHGVDPLYDASGNFASAWSHQRDALPHHEYVCKKLGPQQRSGLFRSITLLIRFAVRY